MNYWPDPAQLRLWDTWAYVHGDDVHLFFLAARPGEPQVWVGHIVSTDWLHWEELPPISIGNTGDWNNVGCGTGMVFRYDDGRFYMSFTGGLGHVESTGLLVSDDLLNWEHCPFNPVWTPGGEGYETPDSDRVSPYTAWRDAFVTKAPDGTWQAVCSGRVDYGPDAGRACLARARLDAIDQWTPLPPLAAVGEYASMEVPEVFEFAGKCWVIFSTTSGWGVRLDRPGRNLAGGTFYLVADQWEGPYRRGGCPDNLLIGAGEGRMDAYVARVVRHGDQHLVYHHYASSPPAAGWPKLLNAEGDHLYLSSWAGLAKLRTDDLQPVAWAPWSHGSRAPGEWRCEGETVIGQCEIGASLTSAEVATSDLDWLIDVEALRRDQRVPNWGVMVGGNEPDHGGVGILFTGASTELVEIAYRRHSFGPSVIRVLDRCLAEAGSRQDGGGATSLRVINRGKFIEAYVGDRLVFSAYHGMKLTGGRIGLYVEDGEVRFTTRSLHAIEPMERDL